jgi:hypothetical protein
MQTTNVHMVYSPPRTTSSWAKKSGGVVGLAGPAELWSLRPWRAIRRRFRSRGVLAGPSSALMACHILRLRLRRPRCQIMSASCSALCSGRAKVVQPGTGNGRLISCPPAPRTGTRFSTCPAVLSTVRRARPEMLVAAMSRAMRAARSHGNGRHRAVGRLKLASALALPHRSVQPRPAPGPAVAVLTLASPTPLGQSHRPAGESGTGGAYAARARPHRLATVGTWHGRQP